MRRYIILVLCLLLCLCVCLLSGCKKRNTEPEFSQLNMICELATLRCYYHNVAEYEYGADSMLRFGYKKIWIEYGGVVVIGIDANKVKVTEPDRDGLVKVSIPKARVLDVDFDENSINKLTETSLFSRVRPKDEVELFANAQIDMENTARENESMLMQGQERAKRVIEKYIQRVGEALGKRYTVEWVEVE